MDLKQEARLLRSPARAAGSGRGGGSRGETGRSRTKPCLSSLGDAGTRAPGGGEAQAALDHPLPPGGWGGEAAQTLCIFLVS